VREIVSRLLKQFEEQNLVRLGRERIEVLDSLGLKQLAAGN
jgi:CRP/FNR family transcriptional regulator